MIDTALPTNYALSLREQGSVNVNAACLHMIGDNWSGVNKKTPVICSQSHKLFSVFQDLGCTTTCIE